MLIFVNTWGSTPDEPNIYLVQVYNLDKPIDSVAAVNVAGRPVNIDRDTVGVGVPSSEFKGDDGSDYLWASYIPSHEDSKYLAEKFPAGDLFHAWSRQSPEAPLLVVTAKYNPGIFSEVPKVAVTYND